MQQRSFEREPWTLERKRQACLSGRFGPDLVRGDTQVTERPGWYQTLTPSTSGTCNEVVISKLEEVDTERVIDETIAAYRAHGLATKWLVGYWTEPADFGERLARRSASWRLDTRRVAPSPPQDREINRWCDGNPPCPATLPFPK